MADKQPRLHDKILFILMQSLPFHSYDNKKGKFFKIIYLFSLSFYSNSMVEIFFLTSKYFAENISVIRSMFMSKKHSFPSLFSRFNKLF